MKKYFAALTAFALIASPMVVLAQTTGEPQVGYIEAWLANGKTWLSTAITIIMIVLTFVFLINVFKFMNAKADDKGVARNTMIKSLVGLFIAVSVWGIINIAGDIFGTKNAPDVAVPCPPGTIRQYAGGQRAGCRVI